MRAVSNNVYINKLDDIVNKYNNTYSTPIDDSVQSNDKDPKLEVGDHVTISEYENIFAKD